MKIAIYPGSFDPITMGHYDIIERASKIVDKLYVGVLNNPNKNPLFTVEERKEMIKMTVANIDNVEVESFSGLLVKYAREKKASVIIKGLRAVSDFEYEFQMASMNKKLDCGIETLFMMTNNSYSYLSSSVVKDVARFNGCIKGLVPKCVEKKLIERIKSI